MSSPHIPNYVKEQIQPGIDSLLDHLRQAESDHFPIPVENVLHYVIQQLCTKIFSNGQEPVSVIDAIGLLECCKLTIYHDLVAPAIQQTEYSMEIDDIE